MVINPIFHLLILLFVVKITSSDHPPAQKILNFAILFILSTQGRQFGFNDGLESKNMLAYCSYLRQEAQPLSVEPWHMFESHLSNTYKYLLGGWKNNTDSKYSLVLLNFVSLKTIFVSICYSRTVQFQIDCEMELATFLNFLLYRIPIPDV